MELLWWTADIIRRADHGLITSPVPRVGVLVGSYIGSLIANEDDMPPRKSERLWKALLGQNFILCDGADRASAGQFVGGLIHKGLHYKSFSVERAKTSDTSYEVLLRNSLEHGSPSDNAHMMHLKLWWKHVNDAGRWALQAVNSRMAECAAQTEDGNNCFMYAFFNMVMLLLLPSKRWAPCREHMANLRRRLGHVLHVWLTHPLAGIRIGSLVRRRSSPFLQGKVVGVTDGGHLTVEYGGPGSCASSSTRTEAPSAVRWWCPRGNDLHSSTVACPSPIRMDLCSPSEPPSPVQTDLCYPSEHEDTHQRHCTAGRELTKQPSTMAARVDSHTRIPQHKRMCKQDVASASASADAVTPGNTKTRPPRPTCTGKRQKSREAGPPDSTHQPKRTKEETQRKKRRQQTQQQRRKMKVKLKALVSAYSFALAEHTFEGGKVPSYLALKVGATCLDYKQYDWFLATGIHGIMPQNPLMPASVIQAREKLHNKTVKQSEKVRLVSQFIVNSIQRGVGQGQRRRLGNLLGYDGENGRRPEISQELFRHARIHARWPGAGQYQ